MASKIQEKEILYSVYDKEIIDKNLIEAETPDFILTDPAKNEKIGVEITTLYTNKASAISRSDKFLDRYIDSNKKGANPKKKPPYLKNLKVEPVEGGEDFIHKGHAVWHITKLADYFSFFEKVIVQKSKAYEQKIKDLEFVVLLAKDEENYFKPFKAEVSVLYGLLRQHSLFETILKSNFQEIVFISPFEKGNYAIPLKWLIFRSEHAIFKKYWAQISINNPSQLSNVKLLLDNFCVCLIHLGFNNLFLDGKDEGRYIFFGNRFWVINKLTNDIKEYPFFTSKFPEKSRVANIFKNHENYPTLFSGYMKFREDLIPHLNEDMFIRIPGALKGNDLGPSF